MSGDFKDIWDYFLKISEEKDSKKIESDKNNQLSQSKYKRKEDEKEFFVENFEKYMTLNTKKEDLPQKRNKKNNKKSSQPRATLDLHGKSVNEALRQLEFFINRAFLLKLSSVLVIVGKGIHSKDGQPAIKDAVLGWMNNKGAKLVFSCKEASQKHGGKGALIVKLKNF